MAKLIYSAISSLDGFIEDEDGQFDWAVPGDAAHAVINELIRPIGTHLYGRRLYEVMRSWETEPSVAERSPTLKDFARIWRAADKVVFSRTLQGVSTARTRLEREFDPESVRRLKSSEEEDLIIGGPELAAAAFRTGLIDECHLFLAPISVGTGKRCLPRRLRVQLRLLEQQQFKDGMVYLHYRVKR